MNVIYVEKWAKRPCTKVAQSDFLRLDGFVRSRIIPPPIGSITFSFKSGKFTMTRCLTRIRGGRCEVLIADGVASFIGNPSEAALMVKHIEAEIHGLPLEGVAVNA